MFFCEITIPLSYYLPLLNTECPWMSSTDEDGKLKCGDGTFCYADVDQDGEWEQASCCNDHGGRAKCAADKPYMCAQEDKCAGGQDYCCSSGDCSDSGGYRLCNGEGPDLGKDICVRNTIPVYESSKPKETQQRLGIIWGIGRLWGILVGDVMLGDPSPKCHSRGSKPKVPRLSIVKIQL